MADLFRDSNATSKVRLEVLRAYKATCHGGS